jgi:N-acyl amino acid synthase of PEP-CTERM/exosortase system
MDIYSEYFDIVRADTPELVEAALRLRYQVYCVEHPFENPAEHPDGLERDPYDAQSVHCLLIHRPTGLVAGTVRLVLPWRNAGPWDLPILATCDHPTLFDERTLPRARTAEISRFAISKDFRRRAEDVSGPAGIPGSSPIDARRVIPHIALGLMKAVVWMSHQHQATHLCAVMEPALLRLLGRFGMSFTPLGPLVDYHGKRQPCYAPLDHLLRGIHDRDPEVFDLLTDAGRYHQLSAA